MQKKQANTINIYCCGGTGIEIGKKFQSIFKKTDYTANMVIRNLDTSDSNIDRKADNTFVVDTGENGSGKIRITNAQPIIDAVPMILDEFKPEDFSIIITSSGGGSGSVLAPFMAREIQARGKHVIVMMVGATGSIRELENTEKSLLTFGSFSQDTQRTIPMFYLENNAGNMTRAGVDNAFLSYLSWMSIMFSGLNIHLDTQDLRNFLDIEKGTDYAPDLTMLDFFPSEEGKASIEVARGEVPVSIVTLAPVDCDTSPGVMVPYHAEGFLPHGATLEDFQQKSLPVHMASIVGAHTPLISNVQERLVELRKATPINQQQSKYAVAASSRGVGGGVF